MACRCAQLNSRLAGVEIDLRELRKSMDQKLDKLDARCGRLTTPFSRSRPSASGKVAEKRQSDQTGQFAACPISSTASTATISNASCLASLPAYFLAGRGIGVTPTCSSAVYGAP
jgi:hypothetical protein